MRMVTKAAATLFLSVPLTIGLGQAAFAAEVPSYHDGAASATAAGATSSDVTSGFLNDGDLDFPFYWGLGGLGGLGGASYLSSDQSATAAGASSAVVASGFDADGNAYYTNAHLTANSSGATSSVTQSNS